MHPDELGEQEKRIGQKVGEVLDNGTVPGSAESGRRMKDGYTGLSFEGDAPEELRKDSIYEPLTEDEPESGAAGQENVPLHVSVLERADSGVKRKCYNYYEKGEEEKGKKGGKAAIIIAVAVIVLAVAALVFYLMLYFKNREEEPETTTQAETEVLYSDLITCNLADGGVYTAPLSVILESEERNKLYYTLDGTEPDSSSEVYIEEFTIENDFLTELSEEITLKVISHAENAEVAGVLEITFTLQMGELSAPAFSAESGDYAEAEEIEITAEEGAVIYYTYDGTTPTTESDVYTEPLEMKRGNNVLTAIAVNGDRTSAASSVIYNYEPETLTYDEALVFLKTYLIETGVLEDSSGTLTGDSGSMLFGSAGMIKEDYAYYYVVMLSSYYTDGTFLDTSYMAVDDMTGDIYSVEYDDEEEYMTGELLFEQEREEEEQDAE